MICASCRKANELDPAEKIIYQYLDGRPQELLPGTEVARKLHEDCPEVRRRGRGLSAVELAGSSWCDCQHQLPVSAGRAVH